MAEFEALDFLPGFSCLLPIKTLDNIRVIPCENTEGDSLQDSLQVSGRVDEFCNTRRCKTEEAEIQISLNVKEEPYMKKDTDKNVKSDRQQGQMCCDERFKLDVGVKPMRVC